MSESDGVNFSHTKTIKTIFGKDIFIGGHSHPIYVWSGKSILLCILIYSIILFLASSPAFNKFMIFIYSIVTVLISFCLSSYLKHDLQKLEIYILCLGIILILLMMPCMYLLD